MAQTKLELERKEDMQMEINRQEDRFVCQRRHRHPPFQAANTKIQPNRRHTATRRDGNEPTKLICCLH